MASGMRRGKLEDIEHCKENVRGAEDRLRLLDRIRKVKAFQLYETQSITYKGDHHDLVLRSHRGAMSSRGNARGYFRLQKHRSGGSGEWLRR